jgi:hypothetical protein
LKISYVHKRRATVLEMLKPSLGESSGVSSTKFVAEFPTVPTGEVQCHRSSNFAGIPPKLMDRTSRSRGRWSLGVARV